MSPVLARKSPAGSDLEGLLTAVPWKRGRARAGDGPLFLSTQLAENHAASRRCYHRGRPRDENYREQVYSMADGTELFEIIHTTRAMRRLKPDPVPDALINRILEAGQCAPNGANAQQWCFLVVKDRGIKQAVQVWYQRAFDEVIGPHYRSSAPPPGMDPERYRRQAAAVQYLTEHFHEAPVWIVPCLQQQPTKRWSGASIYPAVQNMLLAARALGLGATLTTRHLVYEKETEAALGLPPGVHSYAIIPIGYPIGKFGPVRRGPLHQIVYKDRWGQAWDGT